MSQSKIIYYIAKRYVVPGETIVINKDGKNYRVKVPLGCLQGAKLQIELPVDKFEYMRSNGASIPVTIHPDELNESLVTVICNTSDKMHIPMTKSKIEGLKERNRLIKITETRYNELTILCAEWYKTEVDRLLIKYNSKSMLLKMSLTVRNKMANCGHTK